MSDEDGCAEKAYQRDNDTPVIVPNLSQSLETPVDTVAYKGESHKRSNDRKVSQPCSRSVEASSKVDGRLISELGSRLKRCHCSTCGKNLGRG
jgi:hypothetical protein